MLFRKNNPKKSDNSMGDEIVKEVNGGFCVSPSGDLGYFAAIDLEILLSQLIHKNKNINLQIELSNVTNIADSRIVSLLLKIQRKALKRKINFTLTGANPSVEATFKVVNAYDVLFTPTSK